MQLQIYDISTFLNMFLHAHTRGVALFVLSQFPLLCIAYMVTTLSGHMPNDF